MLPGVSDLKADIVQALEELAELTTLDEGSPQAFRVRAYENAQRAVQAVPGDVAELSEAQLTKLDGIGKSTAKKSASSSTPGASTSSTSCAPSTRAAWSR